jgi:polysaccharide deacetylase family protein (PEP-CTERM system associated)
MTVTNALTVDVEDYFHVSAFAGDVPRHQWDMLESRVVRNTECLLDILGEAGVTGTFFVLGWVAERFPSLVRRIHSCGHEIASHSYAHELVYEQSPDEFRADLRRASRVIEDLTGTAVRGYRAPSFSVTNKSLWALDVLLEEGYTFDSSIYPVRHDRYGIPDFPRLPHRVVRPAGRILELPASTVRRFGVNLPVGGGGYFRQFPYMWTSAGIRSINEQERQPAIFYLHPWELDPDQPRINGSALSRFRHYRNLDRTEGRLRRLLSDFRFSPIADVIRTLPAF